MQRSQSRVLSGLGLAVAALATAWGDPRPAAACEGTTERIVGYSVNEDEYVAEERSLSGEEPPHYVTRRLSTDEVIDFVTCPGPGPCTTTEALGVRACSFHPVPRLTLEKLSVTPEGDDPARSEVWFDGSKGPTPLLRVRGEGAIGLRSVRAGSSVVLFLKQTQGDDGCPRTHERAVLLNAPGAKLQELDLTTAPEPAREARLSELPSAEPVAPLAQAAQAAAATGLDALAACWAKEALWIMQVQHVRAAQRARARELAEPTIEVSDVKVIVGAPTAP